MGDASVFIRKGPRGMIIKIWVQPKSSQNQIVGIHGDELKIKLTAPPVDNAANRMCIQFLAKQLDVRKSDLAIIAGENSRHKQVLVDCRQSQSAKARYQLLKQRLSALLSG